MTKNDTLKDGSKLITDYDIYLYKQGDHTKMYGKLGSNLVGPEGKRGTRFSASAPASYTDTGYTDLTNPVWE